MRNLARILPLKSKSPRKFQRFNAIDGKIEASKQWKIVEFPKIWIKMKNCTTLYEVQTASHTSPHPQPHSILLCFWNKNSLTEIHSNIHTLAFKVLQECSSWMSRNGAMQIFFSPNRKMFAGKFIKWEQFSVVLRGHISFNVKWVVVCRMKDVFWVKLYCKMSDLYVSFFLALRLFARKPEIKRKSGDVHWNVWTNKYFSKKNSKYDIWIIYILVQILFFYDTTLGSFSQIFLCRQPWWLTILFSPLPPLPEIASRKLSTQHLVLHRKYNRFR